MENNIYGILKKYFGYDTFRESQEEVIGSILSRHDTLVVMPTGGGKSLCYQVPALLLDGVTLVVSPLISLMKDQVDSLKAMGISSEYINSSLSSVETSSILRKMSEGEYKIVYVAPERLNNPEFIQRISGVKISQLAVDEAHCISQWGHDFRRSYLGVAGFVENLVQRPVLTAFTATATPKVRGDIVKNLGINPKVFITGFDRENLKFSLVKGVNSLDYIKKYLKEHSGEAGIVYCATRKEVDAIYNELKDRKYKVGRYHAGLNDRERQVSQEDFIHDRIEVMVATNAFGMGIDKSNVRFVIHSNLPKDLESYYQEAGRAGRDGLDSHCILIFNPKDIKTQRFFIENNEFESSQEIIDIKYEKLSAMVNYCHTSKCLRSYVLEYFGENGMECCDNCSSCLDSGEEQDITVEAQKIISCIGRTKERYGVNVIVGILSGSRNKNILQLGLDKVSTYGLLSRYPQKEIRSLVDLLIGDGFIEVTTGEYPTLRLTEKAYGFIKNGEKLYRRTAVVEKTEVYGYSVAFEKLKELRLELAKEEGRPPFTVFSDATLREMAKTLPTSRDDLLNISGVGDVKFERYGNRFMSLMEEIKSQGTAEEKVVEEQVVKPPHLSSDEFTALLFSEGLSAEDVAQKRNLSTTTVIDHLIKSYNSGKSVDLSALYKAEEEKLIMEVVRELGEPKLKEIKQKLPDTISYETIRVVLALNKV